MTSFPAYTLERKLTEQAVTTRDQSTADSHGAKSRPNFQPYLTVPCRLFWAKLSGGRSLDRTYVNVSREVSASSGGLIMPLGTDVTAMDQIAQINEWDPIADEWVLKVIGPMQIASVVNQDTHLEVGILRTQPGA